MRKTIYLCSGYFFGLDLSVTFQGEVSILIKVTERPDYMSYILIHINDMNVKDAKVYKPAKSNSATPREDVALKDTFEYPENDLFVSQLEDDLEIGQYVLVMSYKSTFSIQLNGLYIFTYTNEKGEKDALPRQSFNQ